jgi:membrane protein DedA with SNARE-associated domain
MEQLILTWITQYGYLAIFLLLVFGIVGLPIPDETLLTFTGYLVFRGALSLPLAYGAAVAGSISGITVSYLLGRRFGLPLIHRFGKYLRLNEEHLKRAHAWFNRAGHWSLTFGYYVPAVRHLTAYAAGMSGLEPPRFAAFAYSGALLWAATFIGLGYVLGERWQAVQQNIHHYLLLLTAGAALLAAAYLAWRFWWKARSR